jgi:multimeric flavodoxin WrbA
MRVVAILGSHRDSGNGAAAVQEIVAGLRLRETDQQTLVALNRCRILPCLACDQCRKGNCLIKDDFEMIMDEVKQADLVIFATPVYFNGVSSMMKTFIDRAQQYYAKPDSFSGKKRDVILLATAGAKTYEDQFEGVRLNFQFFLQYLQGKLWNFIKIYGADDVSVSQREELKVNLQQVGQLWREQYDARG